MAWQLLNRVYTIGTVDGDQDITPGAAVAGFRDFTLLSSSNTTYIVGVQGSKWAFMLVSKVGSVLRPSTYVDGSNGVGSTVTFDAGTITVFSDLGGSKIVYEDGDGNAQNAAAVLRTFSPETLAALKTTPLPSSGKSVVFLRGILSGDNKAAFYEWDPDETASGDDFNYVVSSLSATGRWVRQKNITELAALADDDAAYENSVYSVDDEIRRKRADGVVKSIAEGENYHQGEFATFAAWQAIDSGQWRAGDTFVFRGILEDGDLAGQHLTFAWNASSTNTDALGVTHLRPDDISGSNAGRAVLTERSAAPKFADSDATPSLAGGRVFRCADTAPGAITALEDMVDGYPYYIFPGAQDQTFTHGASLVCENGEDFTLVTDAPPILALSDNGVVYLITGGISRAALISLIKSPQLTATTERTISSGGITLTGPSHTIDTESDAASDDLTDIAWWADAPDGAESRVRCEDPARTINFVHEDATGKIVVSGGEDRTLDDKGTIVTLKKAGDRTIASFGGIGPSEDVSYPEEFGCVGDGVTDDETNFQAWASSLAGKTGILPAGKTYLLNSDSPDIAFPAAGNFTLRGMGGLIHAPNAENVASIIRANGTRESPVAYSGSISLYDTTHTTGTAHGLSVGDYVFISSDDELFAETGTSDQLGYYARVSAVGSATTFETWESAPFAMSTNVIVEKQNFCIRPRFIDVRVRGGGRLASDPGAIGILCAQCLDPVVEGCDVDRADYQAIVFDDTWGGKQVHNRIYFDPKGANENVQYGNTLKNGASDCEIGYNVIHGGKHGVVWTQNAAPGIARNISIHHNKIYGTWDSAIDTHDAQSGCEVNHNLIENCEHGLNINASYVYSHDNILRNIGNNAIFLQNHTIDAFFERETIEGAVFAVRYNDSETADGPSRIRFKRLVAKDITNDAVDIDYADTDTWELLSFEDTEFHNVAGIGFDIKGDITRIIISNTKDFDGGTGFKTFNIDQNSTSSEYPSNVYVDDYLHTTRAQFTIASGVTGDVVVNNVRAIGDPIYGPFSKIFSLADDTIKSIWVGRNNFHLEISLAAVSQSGSKFRISAGGVIGNIGTAGANLAWFEDSTLTDGTSNGTDAKLNFTYNPSTGLLVVKNRVGTTQTVVVVVS